METATIPAGRVSYRYYLGDKAGMQSHQGVHPGWCFMTVAIDRRSGGAFGLFARAVTSKHSGVY